MEKGKLLQEIHVNHNLILKYSQNLENINYYEREYISSRVSIVRYMGLAIIIQLIGSFLAGVIITLFKLFRETNINITYLIIFNILLYSFLVFFLYVYLHKRKRLKGYDLVASTLSANNAIVHELNKRKVTIPSRYWNKRAISKFKEYLTTNRADTLKDCIRIFESEKLQYDQIPPVKSSSKLDSKAN